MSKLPKEVIDKARDDVVGVIERYGVQLQKAGSEFKGLCPFHSEKSPSFTVTPNKGRYHCFGCGASGDAIQFVQDYLGIEDFREAVNIINGDSSDTSHTPREKRTIERDVRDVWTPMPVVPDTAGATPDIKYLRAPSDFIPPKTVRHFVGNDGAVMVKHVVDRRWAYRNAAGLLIGYITRINLAWGGKEVIPQTYCANADTGEIAWRWQSFSKPRPIYGLELLAANPKAQVLIVEGEKACDAARELFAEIDITPAKLVVVSWPGGSKAIKHVDWSALAGRSVALWPDADQKNYPDIHPQAGQLMPFLKQVGTVAMQMIYEAIKDSAATVKLIMPPDGVPDGWDLADELPAGFYLKAHMRTAGRLASDVFTEAPEPEAASEPVAGADNDVPPWEGEDTTDYSQPAPVAEKPKSPTADDLESPELAKNGYFRVLGYDHDRYFIMQYEKCQIMVYSKSDFSEPGLIELAPVDWWETHFGETGKIEKKAAMNWIVRTANRRGVYDMSRLRGRGAWVDAGRNVFHHGDRLTVDGEPVSIAEFDSRYVYEMARPLPDIADTPLTDEEGRDLLDLAFMFRWAKPASAALLTGWIALAPICGALRWRSHVWITGGAGSGKSTLLNHFVHHLLNGMDLYAQGNSSEAGIRQRLKGDAIPVLFDESESNTERDAMRIQSVLSLVRQSSSESPAEVLKGTAGGDAMSFHIRSMFCLASIQVGVKQQADIDRMTVLSLMPRREDTNAADTWIRISDALHVMSRDEGLPGRLVCRSLKLLPITLKNIKTFSEAAAMRFGSQREGDQYGTLLAGAWSVMSSETVDLDGALGLIDSYDWSEHRENNEVDESERAMSALMGALIRVSGVDISVNELVRVACGQTIEGVTITQPNSAEAVLQRHGIRTMQAEGVLILSNTSEQLKHLMVGTPFEADLRGVLLRVKGAKRYPKAVKFSGIPSRAISLPLEPLLTDEIVNSDGSTEF